jgi:hypothetical protein
LSADSPPGGKSLTLQGLSEMNIAERTGPWIIVDEVFGGGSSLAMRVFACCRSAEKGAASVVDENIEASKLGKRHLIYATCVPQQTLPYWIPRC